jgi:hypothetical protein
MYITFLCVGAFLIAAGLIVWVFKFVDIIAGYDPYKVIDREGLARWTGRNLVLMGTLIMIAAFTGTIVPGIKPMIILYAYMIIIAVLSIVTIAGTRRYGKYKNRSQR